MNRTPVTPAGLLRTARDSDADRIREFVCGLSPRSQHFRFFATVAPPSTGLMRALSGATGSADILLVTDGQGAVIGHGMAADQGWSTDIGVVVADRWQQRGIGTLLLSALVDRAAGRGIRTLVLDVLPANERMLGIIARRWPAAPRERTPDAIVIKPQLPGPTGSQHVPVPSVVSLVSRYATGEHRAA
jgi:RimJ/RimL family protein N-acetyltransferase